jgi:protein SCO1/2
MSKWKIIGISAGVVAVSLLLIGAAVVTLRQAQAYRGSTIDTPVPAGDFTLTDQNGDPFRLSEHTGKVVLIFFGYTYCPDVCPTTLADFKHLRAELGSQSEDVEMVFITVDPGRDTPERLALYLDQFQADIVGLSGSQADLQRVWNSYGVFVEKDSGIQDGGYLVTHSARVYGVNRAGDLRITFPFGFPVEDLAHDVRLLLREETP